jgi:hypothetical protein
MRRPRECESAEAGRSCRTFRPSFAVANCDAGRNFDLVGDCGSPFSETVRGDVSTWRRTSDSAGALDLSPPAPHSEAERGEADAAVYSMIVLIAANDTLGSLDRISSRNV